MQRTEIFRCAAPLKRSKIVFTTNILRLCRFYKKTLILDIVQAEMFGEPLYPNISDKAAIYFYNIICNHVFTDGNKRTGLAAALIFLNLNKYEVNPALDEKYLYDYTVRVASGESSLEECRAWFEKNSVKI